jgi:ADP-ribosylglycohydrolase
MLGAIAGDIVGSRHEFNPIKQTEFELFTPLTVFTDDSVLTVGVADAIMNNLTFEQGLVKWGLRYLDAGYGLNFLGWLLSANRRPYYSWGNGSAMRVSSVAWLGDDIQHVEALAVASANPSHNHHHGIRGAKATAIATRMALEGWSKEEIRNFITDRFGYDLSQSPDDIRPNYRFFVSCQKSVPQALCCFLAGQSWEEAVRMTVSLGGDADTQGAIAGAVAEGMFGLPEAYREEVLCRLPADMKSIITQFQLTTQGRVFEKSNLVIERDLAPETVKISDDAFQDEAVQKGLADIERVMNSAMGIKTTEEKAEVVISEKSAKPRTIMEQIKALLKL